MDCRKAEKTAKEKETIRRMMGPVQYILHIISLTKAKPTLDV